MPIFEYQCSQCGNQFEHLLLKNSPAPECPKCHSQELTKLLSLTSVSTPSSKIRTFLQQEQRTNKAKAQTEYEKDFYHHGHDHHDDH